LDVFLVELVLVGIYASAYKTFDLLKEATEQQRVLG